MAWRRGVRVPRARVRGKVNVRVVKCMNGKIFDPRFIELCFSDIVMLAASAVGRAFSASLFRCSFPHFLNH